MRRTMVGIVLSTALVAVPFSAFAQSMNLWVGTTWKLNVAKSKFDPAGPPPPFTSATSTYDMVNGVARVTTDSVNAQGQKVHLVNLITFDGKEQPTVGANTPQTRTYKWIDERTFEWVQKGGPLAGTVRAVMARDGKTRTMTVTGKNPQGQTFTSVSLWEKQ